MPKKLLITDLDNTLYDWVTFFTSSFRGMIEELTKLLGIDEEELLGEFRTVHQKYGNSEQPFAVLELPSVLRKYPGLARAEVTQKLDPALHRFNSIRKRTLSLYPDSAETFQHLTERGVTIVGHTEAILANAYWRIKTLGIDRYFSRLYTLQGMDAIHVSDKSRWVDPPNDFVTVLPREERKPNPRLIADICRHEGIELANTYYLGDKHARENGPVTISFPLPLQRAVGRQRILALETPLEVVAEASCSKTRYPPFVRQVAKHAVRSSWKPLELH
jgi:FMN phosphatase YigB (HAD superfamily)